MDGWRKQAEGLPVWKAHVLSGLQTVPLAGGIGVRHGMGACSSTAARHRTSAHLAEKGSRRCHSHTQPTCLFPMYVMKISDALDLVQLDNHDKLLQQKKIVEWQDGMIVIFVSHQWLSRAHPDKQMQQFAVLQGALRSLISGSTSVNMCPITATNFVQKSSVLTQEVASMLATNGYIWYDYFSVPQIQGRSYEQSHVENLQKAVDSIPDYVQFSTWFFVLSPSVQHSDEGHTCNLQTWISRGWCRVELCAQALAVRDANPIFVVTQSDCIVETRPFLWVHAQPAYGQFAVELDRKKVGNLMCGLIESKVSQLLDHGDVFGFRFLMAIRAHAKGIGHEPSFAELTLWLQRFYFDSAKEEGECGWAPIHFAALEGNVPICDELLAAGEDVDRQTAGAAVSFKAAVGMTPLMIAMAYIPSGETTMKMAQYFVKQGAYLEVTSQAWMGGSTVLHHAADGAAADPDTIRFLVKQGANLEAVNNWGFTPLLNAAFY